MMLFASVLLLYPVYLLLLQPTLILSGEMWAEMAVNYFQNAGDPSLWHSLTALDAGYVPLPQRLIALMGTLLTLPAATIPFFYTWSAVFLTAALVGSFCLAPFRKVIANDYFRLIVALAILVVADFETRSFINFTYFGAFFIAILGALALADARGAVPKWAWVAPIIALSKPAVLAAVPVLLIAVFLRNSRFRYLACAVGVACALQVWQIILSHRTGIFAFPNELDFGVKIYGAVKYFLAFLGGYAAGRDVLEAPAAHMLGGLLVILLAGLIAVRAGKGARAIIFVGITLIFSNSLLNAVALSQTWNFRLEQLPGLHIYRHVIVGFFGAIMVVAGMIWGATEYLKYRFQRVPLDALGLALFIFWFAQSGWLSYGLRLSHDPAGQVLRNSKWQALASSIDSGLTPLCVPVNPLGWIYGRNCGLLNAEPIFWPGIRYAAAVQSGKYLWSVAIDIPSALSGDSLLSLLVLGRAPLQSINANGYLEVTLKNGNMVVLRDSQQFDRNGGAFLFSALESLPIMEISEINLSMDAPVDIAHHDETRHRGAPLVLWMGK